MNTILRSVRRAIALPCLAWMCHVSPVKPVTQQGWIISAAFTISLAVSIALAAASAAVAYAQQQQAAAQAQRNQAAMMRAQDAAIAQNAALANRAYMENTKALQLRQVQADEAAYVREKGVSTQAAQARSTALTAAGEAGVSGLSVSALMDDFTRQEVDYRFQSQTQLGYERTQTEQDLKAAQLTGEGRVQSLKPYQAQPVNYPSLLGAGLRVGAEVGSKAYNDYRNLPQTPNTASPYVSRSDQIRSFS